MSRTVLAALVLPLCSASLFCAELPLTRIAHVAIRVSDIAKSREFYARILGFEEAFQLKDQSGGLAVAFLKVKDRQYIELYPGLKPGQEKRLAHVCLETADLQSAVSYFTKTGLAPWNPERGAAGNLLSGVKDPDGNVVEFLQYLPGSLHANDDGKSLGAARVGTSMLHAGILVRDVAAAVTFYRDRLGFVEIRRDTAARPAWAEMRASADGREYLQLMQLPEASSHEQSGHEEHIAIAVSSLDAAVRFVLARGLPKERLKVRAADASADVYDPDGTRVELVAPSR